MTDLQSVRVLLRQGATLVGVLAALLVSGAACGRRARPDGTTSTQQSSGAEGPSSGSMVDGGAPAP